MKALCLDDSVEVLNLLDEILSSVGVRSESVTTVESALKLCQAQEFDFIIVDYNLGSQSGEDFVINFRSKDIETPVFLFTGEDFETQKIQKLSSSGFSDIILSKNFIKLLDVIESRPVKVQIEN